MINADFIDVNIATDCSGALGGDAVSDACGECREAGEILGYFDECGDCQNDGDFSVLRSRKWKHTNGRSDY